MIVLVSGDCLGFHFEDLDSPAPHTPTAAVSIHKISHRLLTNLAKVGQSIHGCVPPYSVSFSILARLISLSIFVSI